MTQVNRTEMTNRRNKIVKRRVQGEHDCILSTVQLYSSVFLNLFSMTELLKYLFVPRRSPANENKNETERQLEITPRIANCRTKSPKIFGIILGIFRDISEILFTYATIFRWNPKDFLRNPGTEILV
jgi:hypothetical protein